METIDGPVAAEGVQGEVEMTMRENVARAMWANRVTQTTWDGALEHARNNYLRDADSALAAVHDNLKARLQHDEEGVLEMLRGLKGPLED